MSNGNYDIIIIGSGAGGGTLARHLAASGKSILLLERGDWLKREPENWSAEEVFRHPGLCAGWPGLFGAAAADHELCRGGVDDD